jgi:8-oxo-dGTP diphosphatase
MSSEVARPRIAAYVLLRRAEKVAFVLRKNTDWMNGYYGFPAGKVNEAESFTAGGIREAEEEAGVVIAADNMRHIITVHRNDPDSDKHFWVDVYFEADSWQGDPHNAEPDEHSELAWLDLNDLPENVIPAQRFAIECIQAGKQYAEYGWT